MVEVVHIIYQGNTAKLCTHCEEKPDTLSLLEDTAYYRRKP
jgi:hypothetical protein